jgi:hypothetical protein
MAGTGATVNDGGTPGVVPLSPDGQVVAYIGETPPPAGEVSAVVVARSGGRDAVSETLRNVSTTTARVAALGSRIQVDLDDVLDALREVAEGVPVGVTQPETQLSKHDQDVLRDVGLLRETTNLRPRASVRSAVRYAQMLSNSVSVKQGALRLRVSEQRIRQRLAERSLYGFQAKQGWCIPDFQFDVSGELRGLKQVLQALPADLHPLSVEGFFLQPKPELMSDAGEVPVVEWLASGGNVDVVVELARDVLTA